MNVDKLNSMQWYIGIVIAVLLIISGIGDFVSYNKFEKNSVKVEAVVSQVESRLESNGKRNEKVYIPYVDYEYDGMVYRKTRLSKSSMMVNEGDKVTVVINPDNPSQVMKENAGKFSAYSKLLGGFTLMIIMIVKLKQAK